VPCRTPLMAGDHAEAMYAHAEAERHYRTAAQVAVEVGDPAREAEALEKLAALIHMLARRVEALELYERALQQYHALGDREGERRTVSRALDLWGLEGLPRVLPLLSSAEVDSGGDPTPGLAALYTSLAKMYVVYDRYAESLLAAERAEQFARALHDDALLVQALHWRTLAACNLGEDVLPQWIEHIALAERVGDLWILMFTLNGGAICYREDHADLVRATPYLERALAVAERRGGPAGVLFTLANWVEHHYVGGDWTAARACAERGGALMREVERGGIPWGWYLLLLAVGTLDLAQGRTRDGEQRLEQAVAYDEAASGLEQQRGRQRALA